MQNKGAIRLFAIAFAVVCLFQLSFTFVTRHIENKAEKYAKDPQALALAKKIANGNTQIESSVIDSVETARTRYYLDSIANKKVWLGKYTYKDCKERELNLGLDLKGGMNVTMEVSVADVVNSLSGNSTNATFRKAMDMAKDKQKNSQKDFVTLFGESFKQIDPNASLAAIFANSNSRDQLKPSSTNDEVLKYIRKEASSAFDRTFNILRTRIDRFGVTQPNIQKLATSDRILIELPGIKEPERVRKLLQGSAKLEFWETYRFNELAPLFNEANKRLASGILVADTTKKDTTAVKQEVVAANKKTVTEKEAKPDSAKTSLADKLKAKDSSKGLTTNEAAERAKAEKENPLFTYLRPAYFQQGGQIVAGQGATVGSAAIKDTARVNKMLEQVKHMFPRNLKLAWSLKPEKNAPGTLELIALRSNNRENTAALFGDVIVDSRQDYSQDGGVEVTMRMNNSGAKIWKNITHDNIGKQVAVVLDDYVHTAPRVQVEIPNGSSQITGQYTVEEAIDLANVLKAGKLPAPAKIVEEAIVGPTLGQEAINAGLWSFVIAFAFTLLYMIFYYHTAGLVANVALFVNMFFVMGILASLGAVLTLPGIAGIVLTLGMDVDKNVIIYERIREELRAGKGIRLAVQDGYKHALSAIIDSNVTTLLTGIVLYVFGSGPVQGFATTLIIGTLSSLFCAIYITKLLFYWMLDKNYKITLWSNTTKNILTNTHIDFIGLRKYFYIFSLALVLIGIISLSVRGLSYGIDFKGGRSYVVRFDKDVKTQDVRSQLAKVYGQEPEVKTFGPRNQVKITTSYMIEDHTLQADSIVEQKLFDGLKNIYTTPITKAEFSEHQEGKALGKLSSQKVEPMIAYSLLVKAYYAVFFSLIIIFTYIALRFRKWQWGLGGVISLFHDTFIIVAIFSLFYGILPFNLDIDQHFIAAILTIIGYSIMDTVIIFDRVREYIGLYPKRTLHSVMNDAINSTLSRTLNTSGITFMVLLMMFIFGGESIRGFIFAMLIGVLIGTYSSIFNAAALAYDFIRIQSKKRGVEEPIAGDAKIKEAPKGKLAEAK